MQTASRDAPSLLRMITGWIGARLLPGQVAWFEEQVARIGARGSPTVLATSIGLAPRRLGKAELVLDDTEQRALQDAIPGADMRGWSIDQAARVGLVLASYGGDDKAFAEGIETLYRSGEFGEQIALLRGLPFYPPPELMIPIAGEGVRSAVQPVFEAVAHDSPFAAMHFGDAMWNQMVVKALFIESRLAPIQGLDQRRNGELARMLVDYAHERWAAGRAVSPELWRCVGPFAGDEHFDDLVKTFRSGGGVDRKAAALALSECPNPQALVVLETAPTLWRDIRSGALTWDHIA